MCAGQAEAGFGCPITMTFAAVPALRVQPDLAAEWEPLLTSPGYDGALVPAQQKGSAKVGMAMTEKQGGSDVRANTTTATALAGGGEYALRGHKWLAGDGGLSYGTSRPASMRGRSWSATYRRCETPVVASHRGHGAGRQ